jgi:transcriptional regulator with XRE-family HTH domain
MEPLTWLRLARECRGWTQTELAQAAGMRQVQVSRLERGLRQPRLETARKLADALDTSVDRLFPSDGSTPAEYLREHYF